MKATLLFEGKPIMEVEPVSANFGEIFECGEKPELEWRFKGVNIDGCHELKVNGEVIKPWYAGQTGVIELTNGTTIEFIAVDKGERQ